MKNIKIISLVLLVVMAAFVFSACSPNKKTEPQIGNLTFEEVDAKSIDNSTVEQWYEENWKSEGIFSFDSNENKYILISAGQKPTEGYSVEVISIEGKEDEIVVDAKVNAPKEEQTAAEVLTYPAVLVKIQNDERAVVLGNFENVTVEAPKDPTPEQTEKTGVYVGLIDNNSCEIRVDDNPIAFRLSEDVKDIANDLRTDDKVKFSYYENEYEQMIITKIEKIDN